MKNTLKLVVICLAMLLLTSCGNYDSNGRPVSPVFNNYDGVAINWLGSLSESPESPVLLAAYYNTTDKISYVYDGSSWQILSQDGAAGTAGIQGEKGDKGDTGDTGPTGSAGANGTNGIWGYGL
jgi:hypothetical protein